MRSCLRALAVLAFAAAATPASAVIVVNGSSSAPSGLAAYGSVGEAGIGGAVYLGNDWVLTAYHVGFGLPSVDFGSGAAAAVPGSLVVLHLPGDPSTNSDLVLYRLASDPGVPAAVVGAASPSAGTSVTMVGYGSLTVASTTPRYYSVVMNSDTDWTWTPTGSAAGADFVGITTQDSGRAKRWGTNSTVLIENDDGSTSTTIDNDYDFLGGGTTRLFATAFTAQDLNALGSSGDSGGAVFNSAGELIGIMDLITSYPDEPGDLALYYSGHFPGQATFSADLAAYRDQIYAVVPEPSMAVALIASLGLIRRRRQPF